MYINRLACLLGSFIVIAGTTSIHQVSGKESSDSSSSSACSGDVKVESQSDLDPLKQCKKYSGSITIEQASVPELNLPGVMEIDGDIHVRDSNGLSRLSFPQLQSIKGIYLDNNRELSSLDLNSLTSVQTFQVAVHPALSEISFPAELSRLSKMAISDTTITRLDGLKMEKVGELLLDNNIYLRTLDVGNLTEVSQSMSISANSPDLTLDLSHLNSLGQGSFRNLAEISIGELDKVNGDLSFISNKFSSLKLSKMTEVQGTLTLADNKNLEKLSVPELKHVGGALSVGNNTRLSHVDAFPKLEQVDGTVDLTGSFDEVKLPRLQDVRGGLNVQTTSDKFSCDDVGNLKQEGVIKGDSFTCKARVANPKSGLNGNGLDTGDSSSNSQQLFSDSYLALALIAVAITFT
ncbi:hypothetical protein BDC45DRAFT_446065 [Circinella umbellata]|nr:hypothetical protein BDC45DRAFT_446065 [Circinella umbellata]